ncbi:MAG: HlyD family efflux transporter periplasmic adaptor subunit [Gammaproteobacteria bacterium]|nr:HlyD family efflux transporter periplasmic adaptor subunit [Gammaproteobacteria bacterium]
MRIKVLFSFFFLLTSLLFSGCDSRANHSVQGYVESEDLYLASPYAGTLVSLPVSRGAAVKKGDLIFRLASNPEQLKVMQLEKIIKEEKSVLLDLKKPKREAEIAIAEAQVKQVEARLSLAKLRMRRFKELYAKKAGSRDESDAAFQRFKELQALRLQRLEQVALSKLGARDNKILAQIAKLSAVTVRHKMSEWELGQKTRYAPDAGTVADTFFVEGEWVPAGKPVASIQLPQNVWIEFFVPVTQLPKLREGQKVTVTCAGCSSSKAVIAYIAPSAEYAPPLTYSRNNYDKLVFRVRAKPMKTGLFKAGQPVTVSGF